MRRRGATAAELRWTLATLVPVTISDTSNLEGVP